MSSVGFSSITTPIDGIPVTNDFSNKNILAGVQTSVFGNLTSGTTYYFKIFGYTGTGASIDYKTDGSIMQTSVVAQ